MPTHIFHIQGEAILKLSCVRYRLEWKAVHVCNYLYTAKYNNKLHRLFKIQT